MATVGTAGPVNPVAWGILTLLLGPPAAPTGLTTNKPSSMPLEKWEVQDPFLQPALHILTSRFRGDMSPH